MKLGKSLLLGTAAGLASVAGAQAADLPVRKAAPAVAVDYVRVCSTYGSGYFVVPGTEGCLRVSGRVRVDVLARERFSDFEDRFGIRVRGRVQLEHRQATSYGLLRTVVRLEMTRDSGTAFNGVTGVTDSTDPTQTDIFGFSFARANSTSPSLAQAYIQFGGLTAGRVTSFFSNPDLPTGHMGTLRFDDAPDISLIGYTFDFGGGFSGTLSMEDPWDRRLGTGRIRTSGAFFDPTDPFFATNLAYGGADWPDVVANLKWKGTWGSFQLSGALHEVAFAGTTGAGAFNDEDELGWAIRADGHINLPSWGPSTALWAAVTYADGALAYVSGQAGTAGTGGGIQFGGRPLGGLPIADGFINVNGGIDTTTGWSIAGGFRHAFSPQWRTNIFGSYLSVDYGSGASARITGGPFEGARVGFIDFSEWRVGANVFYTPVAGLDFGLEVLYANVDAKNRFVTASPGAAGGPDAVVFRDRGGFDVWEGRVRIQRDF
jgi:hypothetical protein